MAKKGAPLGNQNAARGRIWRAAIHRALERRTIRRIDGVQEIDALAEKLLELVASGDLPALREFGDRVEGKPSQNVEMTGADGGAVIIMAAPVDLDL